MKKPLSTWGGWQVETSRADVGRRSAGVAARPAGGAGSQGFDPASRRRNLLARLLGHSSLSPDECFNCRDIFL